MCVQDWCFSDNHESGNLRNNNAQMGITMTSQANQGIKLVQSGIWLCQWLNGLGGLRCILKYKVQCLDPNSK